MAVGADLSPGMLMAGYRAGLFAMPEPETLGWWSPDPRGILRPADVHVSRSLRRSLGRFTVSVDLAFDRVVAGCADPRRPHGWISEDYARSYSTLHVLGWAHSIDVWDEAGALAGGLFGVEVGGLFAGESKYHVRTDASKVALVALATLLAADADQDRIIDVQWCTPDLATLGAVEVPRREYLRLLAAALARPPVLGRHQVARRNDGSAGSAAPPAAGPLAALRSRIRWRST
ncbi:MAG: leucyl/phenylalanyl-tRNA--protein transferase [Candidatus Nanopelagicales bacterium]